jgi:hypothetical protein
MEKSPENPEIFGGKHRKKWRNFEEASTVV